MTEQVEKSFFSSFFSFNLTTICGMIIGVIIQMFSSETRPIWSFLFTPTIYIIASVVAVTIRLFLWLTIEKGTMFEAKHVCIQAIKETVIINAVVLSTLSLIFLINTYILG